MSETERKADMKKVNGIFEMRVKNSKGKEGIWTIDLKKVRSGHYLWVIASIREV